MDYKSVDIDRLENLRIHELRDVARELGVKSPTSLTKEKIIEQVRLIVTGEKEPYYNVHKQGRPAKTDDVDLTSFVKVTNNPDNHLRPWSNDAVTSSYVLKCNEFEYTKSLPTDKLVMGYVDVHPDGYGMLRRNGYLPSKLDAFIPASMIDKYHLINGMDITAVARFVADGKPYALCAMQSYEPIKETFDEMRGGKLGDKITNYADVDIYHGGRYLIKNNNPRDIFYKASELANKISDSGIKTKLVLVNAIPERTPQIDEDKIEVFNVPIGTSDIDLINGIELFIDKCKIEAMDGKVAIVLAGLTDIAKCYNNVFNGENSTKINGNTASKVNAILGCAKSINNTHRGLTLVCIDNMHINSNMAEMFEYDIMNNFSN